MSSDTCRTKLITLLKVLAHLCRFLGLTSRPNIIHYEFIDADPKERLMNLAVLCFKLTYMPNVPLAIVWASMYNVVGMTVTKHRAKDK